MNTYDVFLSHNSADKPAVEELAHRLVQAGIQPWLDTWNLVPGEPWQEAVEEALDACPVCAVFLGPSGLGPWHNEEMRAALEKRVADRSRRYRVIPVLLPGADPADPTTLPRFLRRLTWVDFRGGLDDADAFARLVAGIRGVAPDAVATPRVSIPPQPPVRAYRNFDLRLAGGEGGQLLVEVLDSPAGEAVGTAALPPYDATSLEPGAATDLRALGEAIGDALLPGDVRLRYEASLSVVNSTGEGLRIRLRVHGEAVAVIPWEAARVGEDADSAASSKIGLSLRPRTPLVRYVLAPQAPAPLAVRGPLQVLGIISHPTDLEPLDVEGERMRLEEALALLIERRLVSLEWLPRADAQLLQDALRHGPHVIHYIGHGSYNEGRGEGVLWFTDAEGRGKLLPADWLATLLRDSTVRFVFLNACESGRAAGGLAEVLVRRGLPAALGTQSLLFDDAAIAFAAGFYRALSDGWPVDAAMVEGRKAIVNALGNDPNQPDWAQPILYMRAPDGRLFQSSGSPMRLE